MGSSPIATLTYGFYLGGGDESWEVDVVDAEVLYLQIDEMEDRILAEAGGFTETDYRAEGYWARKRAAEEAVGVTFKRGGSSEYKTWSLVVKHRISVEWSEVAEVDFDALNRMRIDGDWDAKLGRALDALGMQPKQLSPKWLLLAYYG